MDLRTRRDTYNGFGDALAVAFELVLTPFLFGLLGHVVDGRLGTSLVFTFGLAALALAGVVIKMYYGYVERMKAHEAELFGAHHDPSDGRAA